MRWNDRDAGVLRQRHQRGGDRPDLRDAAVDAVGVGGDHRLHRVDDHQAGLNGVQVAQDGVHIGLGGQLAHNGLSLRVFQVQRHRALVARLHFPPHRRAFAQQPPTAQRIAAFDRLCAERQLPG